MPENKQTQCPNKQHPCSNDGKWTVMLDKVTFFCQVCGTKWVEKLASIPVT